MTGDKAVELINEWLNLAKEVGDMNLMMLMIEILPCQMDLNTDIITCLEAIAGGMNLLL